MQKRLIEAAKISNGIALYLAENAYLNDTAQGALEMVARWVIQAPTVDAVEVVRCKDCKHFWESFRGTHCCKLHKGLAMTKLDAFCSYGERRTAND